MWWKRKNVEQQEVTGEKLANKVSSAIRVYVSTKEGKLGSYLNLKINRLTLKGQMVLLLAFCSLFGGMSLYLVLNTFVGKPGSPSSIQPKSISVPRHSGKTGEENIYPNVLVTENDIREVRAFKVFMDSLRLTASGKQIYDSILASRPGLMDTVSMLEQLYLLQQNK